jgi:iron complex transport system substrate-binding protein
MKKVMLIAYILLLILGCISCIAIGGNAEDIIDDHTFIDDMGNKIDASKPYGRIISLSQTHTENLYFIGAGDSVIGVDNKVTFPYEASMLPRYRFDTQNDIDRIVAVGPDLVLISPDINRNHTSLVTALETQGLNVVSFMPNDFEQFDAYIKKLGMLSGKGKQGEQALIEFYAKLDMINKATKKNSGSKINVFFESDEKGYMTPAAGSLPYIAMQIADVNNMAGQRRAKVDGEIHATFGLEKIRESKDAIDLYLTLEGSGSSLVSISQKSEFGDFKAIKNNRVFSVPSEIINSYTFRFADGANEIARYAYQKMLDDITELDNDDKLTREYFAKIIIRQLHLPIFINSDSDYYDNKKFGHTYGAMTDVTFEDEDYNTIETVVMRNYLLPTVSANGHEHFEREKGVTNAEVARFLYILLDIKGENSEPKIKDIATHDDAVIINKVVSVGLMELEDGAFYPDKVMTNHELIEILDHAMKGQR